MALGIGRGIQRMANSTLGTGLIGTGLGMATRGWENRMQLEQARALQQLQMQGARQMGSFNQGLALEMWDQTNYDAQRRQLEKAGLNVGLMYEGGGQGGTTSTPTGNVSGQAATGASTNAGMGIQMMQQMAMQKAQIDLVKAQTDKTTTETEKIAGVDTEESKARIAQLVQLTENEGVKNAILGYDKEIRGIEANIANQTQEDIIRRTTEEANKVQAEAIKAKNEGKISEATYEEIIKQTRQNTVEQQLRISLAKENIQLTKDQQDKIAAEIIRMQTQSAQGWADYGIEQQKIMIQNYLLSLEKDKTTFATGDAAELERTARIIETITRSLGNLLPKSY